VSDETGNDRAVPPRCPLAAHRKVGHVAVADPDITVRLAGGFPFGQIDRLLRDLEPALHLEEPCIVRLDLSGLVYMCPTAQAVVAAAFNRLVQRDLTAEGSAVQRPTSRMVHQYLQRIDFFEPLVDEGAWVEEFTRRTPSGFRPIQHFEDANGCINAVRELKEAVVEACGMEASDPAAQAIYLCLAELAENVLFHADCPEGGFAAAQWQAKKAAVEVAIVDMGAGILSTLTKNAAYADIGSDVVAIEKALEPMVTSKPDTNRGLGLSVTRFLLRRNGGHLLVRSGEGAVYAGAVERNEICGPAFPGTIVSMMAKTDQPLDVRGAWDDITRAGYPYDDA
jgi:hypothetical protein